MCLTYLTKISTIITISTIIIYSNLFTTAKFRDEVLFPFQSYKNYNVTIRVRNNVQVQISNVQNNICHKKCIAST